jgi:hypothetical protein
MEGRMKTEGGGDMFTAYVKMRRGGVDYHPVACVVCLDNGAMGWSVCGKRDSFTYKRAREIAEGRAKKGRPIATSRIPAWCRDQVVALIVKAGDWYEARRKEG